MMEVESETIARIGETSRIEPGRWLSMKEKAIMELTVK
jgi:hypothetical protein